MESIQTTGGLYTNEIRNITMENICRVFECTPEDIDELVPLQEGLSNIVLSFRYNGGRYIYRHPGLGTEALVDRGRETIMQAVVAEAGIDPTLVAMDVENGWRIARFVEHRTFDYYDLNDMVRAMMLFQRLHSVPPKVRWNFDLIKKAEEIKAQIPPEAYGHLDDWDEIHDRSYVLYELAKTDGIRSCYVHGDARDDNFLINKDEIYLIDWEYAGYGDPGFDIGSYVCGGDHSVEDVDRLLFTYFRKTPTKKQKRHFYAYIALTGFFYSHWVMMKEAKGQMVGILKKRWHDYAMLFGKMALEMYDKEDE